MAPSDINEELLRVTGRRLGSLESIDRVEVFPPEKPDRIVATFVDALYPDPVSEAWLEIRFRLDGDCNLVYIEDWAGQRWACRWDRHENDHNAREHFHPPPVVTVETAMDIDLPTDPNRAIAVALAFIDDRIADLWQSAEVSYPTDYAFHGEYGPAIFE